MDLLHGLGSYDVAALFLRIPLGLFFMVRGGQKLFFKDKRDALLRTLLADKVPYPEFNKWFVPFWQFVAGAMLVSGFGTIVAAAILGLIMLIALCADKIEEVRVKRNPQKCEDWLCCIAYLFESVSGLIFIALILAGPGIYSLDNLLFPK